MPIMKPRIEKKLSKKLAIILKEQLGFKPKDIWINNEYADEKFQQHWDHDNPDGLASWQVRANNQILGVQVNHMPTIGGDLDYWGEGTDYQSVFRTAKEAVCWWMFPSEDYDSESGCGGYPMVNVRLTGLKVIDLCRKYVESKK